MRGARVDARTAPARRDRDDGFTPPRRAGLSDVEQSSTSHRRPQHATRRQQPALLAIHGFSGDHGPDGLHTGAAAACGHDALRSAVERGPSHLTGVWL